MEVETVSLFTEGFIKVIGKGKQTKLKQFHVRSPALPLSILCLPSESEPFPVAVCSSDFLADERYRLHHLKSNPSTITYYGIEMKPEADPPPCNRLSQPPPWHWSQGHPGC
jgi:hypothetical protein